MTSQTRLPRRRVLGAAAAAAFVAGCGDPSPDAGPPPDRPRYEVRTPSPVPPRAPLTGLPTESDVAELAAVLVPLAADRGRHPAGLDRADLVELEFAEADLTRIVAVYQSEGAVDVGPVTAVRPAELKLFHQLRPYVVHEDTAFGFRQVLEYSELASVTAQQPAEGLGRRDGHTVADIRALQRSAPSGEMLPAPLFQYAAVGEPVSAAEVRQATELNITVPGHATVGWRYHRQAGWQTTIAGAAVTAANVVVLITPYKRQFVNSLGRTAQLADPLGTGPAHVFAAGQAVTGQWSKAGFFAALNILSPAQHLVRLTPGRTWVVLAPDTAEVSYS